MCVVEFVVIVVSIPGMSTKVVDVVVAVDPTTVMYSQFSAPIGAIGPVGPVIPVAPVSPVGPVVPVGP